MPGLHISCQISSDLHPARDLSAQQENPVSRVGGGCHVPFSKEDAA